MEIISIGLHKYSVLSSLKENDNHITYLAEHKNKKFILKKFHDLTSYKYELYKYNSIEKIGINVPAIKQKSKKKLTIVFKYISGENMLEVISKKSVDENVFDALFLMYRFARFSKIELDYHPDNYVFDGKNLYYLSYEFIDQNNERNLENYGLKFWLYGNECASYLKEKGFEVDKKRILDKASLNKEIVKLAIMKW